MSADAAGIGSAEVFVHPWGSVGRAQEGLYPVDEPAPVVHDPAPSEAGPQCIRSRLVVGVYPSDHMTSQPIVRRLMRPRATVFQLAVGLCFGFVLAVIPFSTAWADPRPMINASERAEGERLVAIVRSAGPFTLSEATSRGFALGLSDGVGHTRGILRLDRVASGNPVFCQPFSFAREVSGWRVR